MRIIAGAAKGRRIKSPKRGTRPTSDRVRESLFNIIGGRITDAAVLDLFSGSGALGLEALSRGASSVDFVDGSTAAVLCVKENMDTTGFSDKAAVFKQDVSGWLNKPGARKYDIIFMDPPYATDDKAIKNILDKITGKGYLKETGAVILEKSAKKDILMPDALEITDSRKYGQTSILFIERRKHID